MAFPRGAFPNPANYRPPRGIREVGSQKSEIDVGETLCFLFSDF
jgi:hypothetical protein